MEEVSSGEFERRNEGRIKRGGARKGDGRRQERMKEGGERKRGGGKALRGEGGEEERVILLRLSPLD